MSVSEWTRKALLRAKTIRLRRGSGTTEGADPEGAAVSEAASLPDGPAADATDPAAQAEAARLEAKAFAEALGEDQARADYEHLSDWALVGDVRSGAVQTPMVISMRLKTAMIGLTTELKSFRESSDRLASILVWLTGLLVFLTLVLIALTIVLIVKPG